MIHDHIIPQGIPELSSHGQIDGDRKHLRCGPHLRGGHENEGRLQTIKIEV